MSEKVIADDNGSSEGHAPRKSSADLAIISSKAEAQLQEFKIDRAALHNTTIVNNAIEVCGMGRYQWQMFFTCGFGFFVDQMLVVTIGVVLPQFTKQWDVVHPGLIISPLYTGSLIGAALCGYFLDVIGRKLIWQISLFVVCIFTLAAAGSPNFTALAILIGLQTIGAGGNIAIDLTVFIESLPRRYAWLMTALALWWGIGNAVGGLIAWPLIVAFSCPPDATPATCSSNQNMGWRYQYIVLGGICFIMACVRVFFMKMEESPKWSASKGDFQGAVDALRQIARKNKVDLEITINDFQPLVDDDQGHEKGKILELKHVRALFATRKLALSTGGISLLWMCIGIAYPLYSLFLPYYLQSHGADLGDGSTYQTYRDYAITSTVGIFGPILAAALVNVPMLGRRRTMSLTAICAAIFAGAFTSVRTEGSNIAFSSLIGFWQNAFYAVLYSYTPEVMPTAHRGTGCGLTLAFGRIASLSSPFIATYSDVTTSVPIWVVLALYLIIAIIAAFLPFEPKDYAPDGEP